MVTATLNRPALQGRSLRKLARPSRSVRLVANPDARCEALIAVTFGDKVTYYRVSRLIPGFGDVAYSLKKVASDARYDLLRDAAGCWTCDGPDATFRGNPCKHAKCLDALLKAGKLA